ncbi:MAG: hypothetical protein IMY88_00795 [Chloroflexi bacterium]|nr:hypothetical protein [Chloroflexota bacterium]
MPSPFELQPLTSGRGWCRWHRADTQTGNTFELIETMPRKYLNSVWMWFLDELDDGTTRLLSWGRGEYRVWEMHWALDPALWNRLFL